MDLEDVLSLRGANLSQVLVEALDKVGLAPSDALFAVGSLVEGRGSPKSDLDLLWITPREASDLPPSEHVTWVVGRCLVELRVLRMVDFDTLVARFEDWAALPWGVSHAAKFSIDDRTLLHRLTRRLTLHADAGGTIVGRVPTDEALARLKLHIARQNARTFLVDLGGYRLVGDHRSMVFSAQTVLGDAVDALLAGHGHTNPLPKWRTRLLADVPPDWEQTLVRQPDRLSAADAIWQLQCPPATPETRAILDFVRRIVAFSRAVFLWAELRILEAPLVVPMPRWPTEPPASTFDAPLPALQLDVDFSLHDGCVYLARLNEFDRPLRLSPMEFTCAMLFDGRTTAAQAANALGELEGDMSGTGLVARLAALLNHAGLIDQASEYHVY